MALVGVEPREAAGPGVDGLAAGLEPDAPVDDDDVRTLVHLMVAERLPRIEDDQDRARLVLRMHDDRRTAAAGRVELAASSSSARGKV